MEIMVASEAALAAAAQKIIDYGRDYKIWLFFGEMGAGKTTLIKNICDALNVEDNVNSPSFTLVNEYLNKDGQKFFHFDFYRIKSEIEALDIGLEEYFESDNISFVEWPEKIAPLWPDRYLKITIDILGEKQRNIGLIKYG